MSTTFESCEKEIVNIVTDISDSNHFFEDVSDGIDTLKEKITRKGFMFEDMHNVLEQIDPLIKYIEKEASE